MDLGLNNRNKLGEIDPMFNDVVFLVEATSEEKHFLWKEKAFIEFESLSEYIMKEAEATLDFGSFKKLEKLNNKIKKDNWNKVEWEQINEGFYLTIGHIDNRPICVSFSFAIIEGKKICFYYGSSEVVDYKMIENWLIDRFQLTNDNYNCWNKTDAGNFHNCINALDCIDKEPRDTVYKG